MGFSRMCQVVVLMTLLCVAGASLADAPGSNHEGPRNYFSGQIGFPGGTPVDLVCPDSAPFMVGVHGRFGNWMDALAPTCVGYNVSGRWDRISTLALPLAGGTGGGPNTFECPMGSRISRFWASAASYDLAGRTWAHFYSVAFQCGDKNAGAISTPGGNLCDGDCFAIAPDAHELSCADGYVARGLRIFSDDEVRSVALICGPTPKLAMALGRVGPRTDPAGLPAPDFCELARSARARNSPTAPALESRCAALTAKPPMHLGRVKMPDAVQQPQSPPPPFTSDRAASLAAIGSQIASLDLQVAAARRASSDPAYQQGFDIATGLYGDPAMGAEGKTRLGPGAQEIRNSLNPDGQSGFDDSLDFHLAHHYGP